ncbi:hypothetical protein [Candidatus Pyrohabitans sp.]
MEDLILTARLVFSVINLIILSVLVYIFFKRYLELKSTFTLGFLLFALALFFRTFFAAPIIKVFVFGVETSNVVDHYRLIADIFETVALLIFIYLSTR